MASMDVDMSLDDMIASKPRGGGRRGGRGGARGGAAAGGAAPAPKASAARARYAQPVPAGQVNGRQAQAAAAVQGGPRTQEQDAFKIIISNLPLDVDDAAVRDLFQSTVGPTKDCSLSYDKNGKHKGVATVVFQKRGDAQKAHKTYNGRLIDGRTPMKVEIVYSAPVATTSLASRVQPVAVLAPAPVYATVAVPMTAQDGGRGGGRGGPKSGGRGGRGGRAAGGDTGKRPAKTQADLDAEMDAFLSQKTA